MAGPDLAGKNAVIVGGTSGIGYGVALAMHQAGARVVVAGRDSDRSQAAATRLAALPGAPVLGLAADVTDRRSLIRMLEAAEQNHGPITTLVCSAGVGVVARISATDEADWDRVIGTNLTGTWRTAVLGLPRLAPGPGSSITTIGSDTSLVADPDLGVYTVSKAALMALSRLLAVDAAKVGIRVNCICPGYIEPGMRDFPNRLSAAGDRVAEPLPPLGRHGQATDVGAAAVYLASDAASFVTGAVLAVDGGFTAAGCWYG